MLQGVTTNTRVDHTLHNKKRLLTEPPKSQCRTQKRNHYTTNQRSPDLRNRKKRT